jgi:hypothetical protein
MAGVFTEDEFAQACSGSLHQSVRSENHNCMLACYCHLGGYQHPPECMPQALSASPGTNREETTKSQATERLQGNCR